MSEEKKQRMSNRTFRKIFIPIFSFLAAISLAATIAVNYFSATMDGLFGRGDRHILAMEGTENWDTKYYEEESTEVAKERTYEVSARIQDEGAVLLKNNGVLPLAKGTSVTPFGYAYTGAERGIFGQIGEFGSAKWAVDPIKPRKGLDGYLTVNTIVENRLRGEPERLKGAAGTDSGEGDVWGNSIISEYPSSVYKGTEESMNGTIGLVFISRTGSEGQDKKRDFYTDGTRHYLALSENEKEAIGISRQSCDKTVVIFVSSAPMELDLLMDGELEADAILWYGHPGERGFSELGKILTGEINPSGRTVDIFPCDFTRDPSFSCVGDFYYTNVSFRQEPLGGPARNGVNYRSFVEYREDMYMGYRYYETAAEEDEDCVYGTLDGQGGIFEAGAVAYPFGYGLSYTSFRSSIRKFDDAGDMIKVTVTVENTGMVSGKEVVQIYYSAPYTSFDEQNRIEKPAVTLAAFVKTEEIPAGESCEVTLEFYKEQMASYCYTRSNPDRTEGCYVLEAGKYEIFLRSDSHTVVESRLTEIPETIWYDNGNPRRSEREAQSALDDDGNILPWHQKGTQEKFVAATNLFRDSSMYMLRESQILTRKDWNETVPVTVPQSKNLNNTNLTAYLQYPKTFNPETDDYLGNKQGSKVYTEKTPVSGMENGLTLSDLRGKSYYDEMWDEFLDQIEWGMEAENILKMLCRAGYAMGAVSSVGLPETKMVDGVTGLKTGGGVNTDATMRETASTVYSPVMAATWNTELIREMGKAFGTEALAHGINGLYAPAINLHRSPFTGRVFEYYSEDPLLSGKMAAAMIGGAGDAGMYTYVKHFALNEQETNRSYMANSWATEQTMRELYFKPFEIVVKEARMKIKYTADAEGTVAMKVMRAATAVMSAQNSVGLLPGHSNYALLTALLRDEWGFTGTVTSDYYTDNLYRDLSFRAGCDLWLNAHTEHEVQDKTSATALSVYREKIHNICYTVANSAAMQSVAPGSIVWFEISPWVIWLTVADVAVGFVVTGGVVWIVLRAYDEKKKPELYRRGKKPVKRK